MIYYKQEKFSLAEIHYRKALSINPHSSVLLCHVGMVSGSLKFSCKSSAKKVIVSFFHQDFQSVSVWSLEYYLLQAQHALKKGENALQTFDRAIAIDSRNPLCKFHRAHLLVAHDKYKVLDTSRVQCKVLNTSRVQYKVLNTSRVHKEKLKIIKSLKITICNKILWLCFFRRKH